jgi:hypothetical protein
MKQQDKKNAFWANGFSVLMLGTLVSIIIMYKVALPVVENPANLNAAAIATIILLGLSYIFAVKGGIPLPGPKTQDK